MPQFDVYIAAIAAQYSYREPNERTHFFRRMDPALGQFNLLPDMRDNAPRGYFGYAICSETTKQIFIIHRGSENGADYLLSDVSVARGRVPLSWLDAWSYSNQLRQRYADYQFIETGHSLGGVHAILNAFYFRHVAGNRNTKSITFDNPGCKEIIEDLLGECIDRNFSIDSLADKATQDTVKKIVNSIKNRRPQLNIYNMLFENAESHISCYLSAPNFINTCNTPIGQLWRIYVQHTAPEPIDEAVNRFKIVAQFGANMFVMSFDPSLLVLTTNITTTFLSLAHYSLIQLINYSKRIHSIDNIVATFDQTFKMPALLREIKNWPTANQYLMFFCRDLIPFVNKFTQINPNQEADSTNRQIEIKIHQIEGYEIGKFWFPNPNIPEANEYLVRLIQRNKIYSDIFSSWLQFFCDTVGFETILESTYEQIFLFDFAQYLTRKDTQRLQSVLRIIAILRERPQVPLMGGDLRIYTGNLANILGMINEVQRRLPLYQHCSNALTSVFVNMVQDVLNRQLRFQNAIVQANPAFNKIPFQNHNEENYYPYPLKKFIESNDPDFTLTNDVKLNILKQVALALKCLHESGRAYKYLDPSHIFLNANKDRAVLVHCDDSTMYEYQEPYASATTYSDIYSFAILLLALITEKNPRYSEIEQLNVNDRKAAISQLFENKLLQYFFEQDFSHPMLGLGFVTTFHPDYGQHPLANQLEQLNETQVKKIISHCWNIFPEKRYSIDTVIRKLDNIEPGALCRPI